MILWRVDTQNDFMVPAGKPYVPDRWETAAAMKRLVEAARAAGVVHVASADDDEFTDDEISDAPDFRSTYPPHCLRGTRGARKIQETEQEDPVLITLEPLLDEFFVFGVATDVCDDAAIRGFLERGRTVRFVEDAARGLDAARVEACTAAWREAGVGFTTVADAVGQLR